MVQDLRKSPLRDASSPDTRPPPQVLDDRLAIFQEVTTALNSSLDPGELLDQILDSSIRYTGAMTGSVALVDPTTNVLKIERSRGLGTDVAEEVKLQVGEGITGWVAQHAEAVNIPDVHQDDRYIMVREHIRSELAAPLLLGKTVIGVISVDSNKRENFNDEDLRVLTFVGTQAAQILQKARTYEELRVKNSQDEILVQIGQVLGSALDFNELFEQVAVILQDRCKMFRSFLVLRAPDSEELSIRLAHGMTEEEIARGRYTLGEGITGTVVESGEPVGVADIRTEPNFLDRTGVAPTGGDEQISFFAVPIQLEGKTVGAIGAMKPFPGESRFDADRSLLQIIASTISQAVRIHFRVSTERESLLRENLLLREELKTRYKYNNLVGPSESMQRVYSVISSVAKSRSTVLIRGESGTGKELIAHAIHFESPRSDRPFVKVNCAAIPENLLEAELFGYKKGAFTGAIADRVGKFSQADGGTIFLDEIGDMSPDPAAQAASRPPGGRARAGRCAIGDPSRWMCGWWRPPTSQPQRGDGPGGHASGKTCSTESAVVPDRRCPPLRDRIEDIPPLIEHFLERFRKENELPDLRISPEAVRLLMRYEWPGNVRELENLIERATILCDGAVIYPADFPEPIGGAQARRAAMDNAILSEADIADRLPLIIERAFENENLEGKIWDEVIGRVEGDLILRALKATSGVRLRAADVLGIHRNTLRKKISELGL